MRRYGKAKEREDMGRYGKVWENMRRYYRYGMVREGMGRYKKVWNVMRRYRKVQECLERCGKV